MTSRTLCAALVVVMAAIGSIARSDEGPRLERLKDFHLHTDLVAAKKPAALIACPNRAAYRPIAEKIRDRIRELSGAELQIVADNDISDADLVQFHVILLGNLMTNALSARLYCQEQIDVDAAWPGPGGCILQTIHNPLGLGRNFISLGGSDDAGVAAAAGAFLERLTSEAALSVPNIFVLKTTRKIPSAPSDEQIEKALAENQGKGFRDVGARTVAAGVAFARYRQPAQARLFRGLIALLWKEMDALEVCDDVRTTKRLPLIWDLIEESDAFSDEDRATISRFMYVFAHKAPYAKSSAPGGPGPHGNNWNAEGSYLAGLYFARYYPDEAIGKTLLEKMDAYYSANLPHWKVEEDCPGYGNITLEGNLQYALTRPRMDYFASDAVHKAADYAVTVTTNFGIAAGFGDQSAHRYAVSVLPMAAWYYRDGGYLWWFRHINGSSDERFQVDNVVEAPPTRFLGVRVVPLDDWIYRRELPEYERAAQNRDFPQEQCFDKISFREGFDPKDQYLLLSGLSYGFHAHPDGNAIVNFSAHGKTLLCDDGYMVPEMSEHNTVIVYRNGLSTLLPELVRLDHWAALDHLGFTQTTVPGWNGVDWTRRLVWKKGRYFLCLDEITAREADNYGFQCLWKTRGDVTLTGRALRATQAPAVLRLLHLDDAERALHKCTPKHPANRRLIESVGRRLEKGQSVQFANLFYAETDKDALPIQAVRDRDGRVVIRDGEETALVTRGPCKLGAFDVEADLLWISPDRIAGIGAKRLDSPVIVFTVDERVSFEADLVKGLLTVHSTAPQVGILRVPGFLRYLDPGMHSATFAPLDGKDRSDLADALEAAWRNAAASDAESRGAASETKPLLRALWQNDDLAAPGLPRDASSPEETFLAMAVSDLDGDGADEIVVSSDTAEVAAFSASGKMLWKTKLGGRAVQLAAGDIDGDGKDEVLAACDDKTLYCLQAEGAIRWQQTPPARTYERPGYRGVPPFQSPLSVVFLADQPGDGTKRIVVGSRNWRTYVYDASGALLWDEVCWAHNPTCGASFDVNGDGFPDVLMGNDYAYMTVYDGRTGKILKALTGTWHAGPNVAAVGDLRGDGKAAVVIGDLGGRLSLFCPWDTEKPVAVELGAPLVALRLVDLDGDRQLEVLAGAFSGYFYIFDAAGVMRRSFYLAEPPRDLLICDVTGDGRAEVLAAGDGGTVFVLDADARVLGRTACSGRVFKLGLARTGRDGGTQIVAAARNGVLLAFAPAR